VRPVASFRRQKDVSNKIIQRWKAKRDRFTHTIPGTPGEVIPLMDDPLQEDEKILLSQLHFDRLLLTAPQEAHDGG
jgi:hypothetical protein